VGESDAISDTGVSDCGCGVTTLWCGSARGIHCDHKAKASLWITCFTVISQYSL